MNMIPTRILGTIATILIGISYFDGFDFTKQAGIIILLCIGNILNKLNEENSI